MDQDSTGFGFATHLKPAPRCHRPEVGTMPKDASASACLPRRGLAGQLPDDVIELPVRQIRIRAVLRGDVLRQMLLVLHGGDLGEQRA